MFDHDLRIAHLRAVTGLVGQCHESFRLTLIEQATPPMNELVRDLVLRFIPTKFDRDMSERGIKKEIPVLKQSRIVQKDFSMVAHKTLDILLPSKYLNIIVADAPYNLPMRT